VCPTKCRILEKLITLNINHEKKGQITVEDFGTLGYSRQTRYPYDHEKEVDKKCKGIGHEVFQKLNR
jgi:hypothetical protein